MSNGASNKIPGLMTMTRLLNTTQSKLISLIMRARVSLLRRKGAKIGENCRIFRHVIYLGDLKNLTIDNNSTLNHGVFLNLREQIVIGRNVHISPYAQLHTGYLTQEEIHATI